MGRNVLIGLVCLILAASAVSAEHVELISHSDDLGVFVEQSSPDKIVVRLDVGGFDQEPLDINGQTYFSISSGDAATMLERGAPALPRVSRSVIIPDDARMAIEVIAQEYVEYTDLPVVPSKGNLLRNVNPEDIPYEFGPEYGVDAFFPGHLADMREPYILRDFRGTVIDFQPFQFNPVTGVLRVYTSITVALTPAGPGEINVLSRDKGMTSVTTDFETIYEQRFINYTQSLDKYTLVQETGDMLVITYDNFADEMQPLVDWKNQKGLKTTMVNISAVGNSVSGIKTFIQNFYDSTNLAYVLLVGDAAQITTDTHAGGGADPKFSLVAGSDTYPDIFIGRFSAETEAQVTTQVQRTLTYEQNPVTGDWFHQGTGIASNQGPGHDGGEYDNVHMGYIRNDLLAYNYTLVDQIYDPSGTAAQVTAALNSGRSIINYTGHGSTTAWSTTGFSNTNVNALANNNMLPFIISVACINGQFRFYTCFAEAWMRATNGSDPTGAIGAYMSSINQSWDPPMDCQDEVTDLLVAEVVSSYGALCYNGSCKMMDDNSGSAGYDMFYTWHIFGDPSVQVRSNTPASLTVNHSGAVFFNSPEYQVEVPGVEGALCALYYDGVLYGSAYTDAGGLATIPISQMLPIGFDPIKLTVTAYNAQTVVEDVVVTTDLTILHEPLGDTKDIVNDYEVAATIYSDTTLDYDSVLVWYGIDDVWTASPMTLVRLGEDFVGYIPVQPAGTQVDYYLWAKNVAGFIDSTDVYSFKVIDYGMFMGPDDLSLMAPVADTVWYDLYVTNDGVLDDSYDLTVDALWPTALYDATGTSEISSTTVISADDSFDFKLRVIVPESWEDETDTATVTAVSTGDASFNDVVTVVTVSAGQPWEIPFSDDFETTAFDATKWDRWPGAEMSTTGLEEPTLPYSVNFDGYPNQGDTLVTEAINLRGQVNVLLKFQYQRTGGGDSPEAGDDLWVEYLDSLGTWQLLAQYAGDGDDMTVFEPVELVLPGPAYHAGFRAKIYNKATSGSYDDWFVDDFFVGYPSDYDVSATPFSQFQSGPAGFTASYLVTVTNRGRLDDTYDLSVAGNAWDVEFADETGLTPLTSTPLIIAGDSMKVMVKVAVPTDAGPHVVDTAEVTVTSQGDGVVTDMATVMTESGGPPIAFPVYEPFETTELTLEHWFENYGAEVSTAAVNPPSSPYALLLDGGDDTLVSRLVDLSSEDGAILTYYIEMGGSGDAPESGEFLYLQYKNNLGEWATINSHEGTGLASEEFEYINVPLPLDAVHAGFQLRLISDGSGANTDFWFVDDIRIDYAPSISVTPGTMNETLAQGDSVLCPLVVSNAGPGGLSYQVSVHLDFSRENDLLTSLAATGMEPANRDYPADFWEGYVDEKGVDLPNRGYEVTRDAGGPDAFGYFWVDSDDPGGPTFDWIDISATGEDIVGLLDDDNYAGPYDIGFDFQYYGGTYSQIYIGSNGIIGFTADDMGSRYKVAIPTASTPNAILAWMWDDLDVTDADNLGAHVYVESDGSKMVIQFVDYPEYSAAAGDVITAEVILFADGTIKYQYQSIAAGFDVASGTVGIENADGTDGLEVAYSTSYLKDNLAILFVKPFNWLSVDMTGGTLAPGEADTINCKLTSGELEEGDYSALVTVVSNDPDPTDNPMSIPISLTVSNTPTYVCADIDGSGSGPDVGDLVYLVTYMFQGGEAPPVMEACDINGDGGSAPDVSDLVDLVKYMFSEGPPPVCGG